MRSVLLNRVIKLLELICTYGAVPLKISGLIFDHVLPAPLMSDNDCVLENLISVGAVAVVMGVHTVVYLLFSNVCCIHTHASRHYMHLCVVRTFLTVNLRS